MAAAAALIGRLDAEERIDFDTPVPDPVLHIDYVWTKGPGRMFGVLVCADRDGNVVVLKAFSGQMSNLWHVPGWVGPVAGITNSSKLYQDYRAVTDAYSARLASVERALAAHRVPAGRGGGARALDSGASGPRAAASRPQAAASRPQAATRPGSRGAGDGARGAAAAGGSAAAAATAAADFLERQRQLLRGRRRALSHELLRSIQASYAVTNFAGRGLQLLEAYDAALQQRQLLAQQAGRQRGAGPAGDSNGDSGGGRAPTGGSDTSGNTGGEQDQRNAEGATKAGKKGGSGGALAFPAGTGDCCAPKLLAAAARERLAPLGLVEFWYGSPPNTATPQGRRGGGGNGGNGGGADSTRLHGEFYGMCEKCEAILGSMLCGAEAAVAATAIEAADSHGKA